MIRRPPRSTLFPDTTLCRSLRGRHVRCIELGPLSRCPPHHRALEIVADQIGDRAGEALLVVRRDEDRDLVPELPEGGNVGDRKSTRLNSSHANISYAVFCLK